MSIENKFLEEEINELWADIYHDMEYYIGENINGFGKQKVNETALNVSKIKNSKKIMKTGKVTNVQGSGKFKELYVFELQLDNGDAGKIYKKAQDAGVKIGEEITYTLNDKGSIKIQREQYSGGGSSFSGNSSKMSKEEWAIKDAKRDANIAKQVSLKAAVELCSAYIKSGNSVNSADVLRLADTFTNWVNGAETEVVAKTEKVVAKIDNTDLPF